MKKVQRNLTTAFFGVALGLAFAVPAKAQQQPERKELEGMILLADGKRQRGFIQDTSKEGLLFALVERGPGNGYYWDTQVTAVAFDTANDIMRDARGAFTMRNYEDAAKRFKAIADDYANIAWVPNGFAAEARYYHIDALRRLGRYEEIGPHLETPAGQAIETRLGEFYQSQHALNKVWALVGAGQWDGVKAALESQQQPQVGNQEMLPTPVFRKMPPREMAQWAFMRAKLNENEGEKKKALDDYYRVATLTYANNSGIAMPAMLAAMAIHKEDPNIENEKNKTALRQLQSIAYLYKSAFGSGEIPPQYAEFSLKPELPKPPPVKEEEDVPPPAEPKKMEPEGGDKPAGDDAAAEKKDDDAEPKPGADGGTEPKPGADGGTEPKPGADGGTEPKPGADGGTEPKPGADGGTEPKPGADGGTEPKPGADGGTEPKPSE